MRIFKYLLVSLFMIAPAVVIADVNLDDFDNDRSTTNGVGTDTYWNPPSASTFQVGLETEKVYAGAGALRVTWENKDLWPSFVIANLQQEDNAGALFGEADAVRMAIAGPAGRIILKLVDVDGYGTGDLADVTVSGSDDYGIYEFRYIDSALGYPILLDSITEMQLLVDAGQANTSGTIYIDSIELIRGTGDSAEVIATVDHFDNDTSIEDDPNAQDSIPSGYSLLPGPFVTTVVDDPAGSGSAVLQVNYNTSPWNVLWVEELDITDWSEAEGISIDIYGTAGGILLKLKDAEGLEEEPTGGFIQHVGDEWDTFTWTFGAISTVDLSHMGKLIVFIEGPSGGMGTIYLDNLKLLGPLTSIDDWECYY